MDVSIAFINKEKTHLYFSSAARPLYYVRDGHLKVVKLKTHSIGSSYTNESNKYTDVELNLQKNDVFYFFSDGFADQFDKDDSKKFSSQRLKQLLTRLSSMESCHQFDEVENTLQKWKGDQRQVDDITIVGLKI